MFILSFPLSSALPNYHSLTKIPKIIFVQTSNGQDTELFQVFQRTI